MTYVLARHKKVHLINQKYPIQIKQNHLFPVNERVRKQFINAYDFHQDFLIGLERPKFVNEGIPYHHSE